MSGSKDKTLLAYQTIPLDRFRPRRPVRKRRNVIEIFHSNADEEYLDESILEEAEIASEKSRKPADHASEDVEGEPPAEIASLSVIPRVPWPSGEKTSTVVKETKIPSRA